ncbi:hypothetical protein ACIBAI_22430 [Streptomyces sp. NPDC051041]|uniref:hypothetical protein n=1 Tax=Streptomyces sp. NPDC051041 TaxID=3365640 RepID=UPI00379A945A
MTRTLGDIARRRALADAAAGFTDRVAVVLYACVTPGQDRNDVIAQLRQHAVARDWVIRAEITDCFQEAAALDDRPGWRQAMGLIAASTAMGIVTTASSSPSAQDKLRGYHAFLFEVPYRSGGERK